MCLEIDPVIVWVNLLHSYPAGDELDELAEQLNMGGWLLDISKFIHSAVEEFLKHQLQKHCLDFWICGLSFSLRQQTQVLTVPMKTTNAAFFFKCNP